MSDSPSPSPRPTPRPRPSSPPSSPAPAMPSRARRARPTAGCWPAWPAGPGKPLVVFTADPLEAQRLAEETPLYAPGLRVRQLPDWGDPALRRVLPAPGLDLRAAAHAQRADAPRGRRADGAGDHARCTGWPRPPSWPPTPSPSARRTGSTRTRLRAQLVLANYSHVTQVTAPGEFCLRGGLIDLFPMGSAVPYRLDLFDNEIESIRAFDVDTQRSLYPVREVQLLPGREFSMDEEARNRFRARFREVFEGDPSRAVPYRDMRQRHRLRGRGVLPAAVLRPDGARCSTTWRPRPSPSPWATSTTPSRRFAHDTAGRHQFLKSDRERPVLPPEALFLDQEDLYGHFRAFPHWRWARRRKAARCGRGRGPCPRARRGRRRAVPTIPWPGCASCSASPAACCCAPTPPAAARRWRRCWPNRASAPELRGRVDPGLPGYRRAFRPGRRAAGQRFRHPGAGSYLPHRERPLSGPARSAARPARAGTHQQRRSHGARSVGSCARATPWCHAQHGIGRYHGLVNMDMGEGEMEFLHLEYASGSTLHVPVSQLHDHRPATAAPIPRPRRCTSWVPGQWDKARRKAAKQVRDTAAELLALYAQRAAREGYAFKLPLTDYEAFAEGFGFEETPDQAAAIARGAPGHDIGKPHGPPGLRRRGLRQDRGRPARRLPGGGQRQAGGAALSHHPAGRAACADLRRPLCRLARYASWSCRASAPPRRSPPPSRASTTAAWTSSSARTRSCRKTSSSSSSAWSSSTRSTASACARRRP